MLGMSSSVTALDHETTHEDLVVEAARALDPRSGVDHLFLPVVGPVKK